MIMLKLIAQTGNNMFQYAACKTLAGQKGYAFCFRGGRKGSLHRYFELDGETTLSLAANRLRYRLRHPLGGETFRPRRKQYSRGIHDECFDSRFFDISDGVTVRGFFQSPLYFAENRRQVLQWFTPRPRYRRLIDEIEAQWPAPSSRRCCIHIRRGDYMEMARKGDGIGWILPLAYYKEALSRLPGDLFHVIVSDDVEFASRVFSGISNKVVTRGNPGVVDMFLFTRCKYNIIANSSFSWWGGWLNEVGGRTIIAPKYHLGWPSRLWLPDRIEVEGWQYIDVMEARARHGDEDSPSL